MPHACTQGTLARLAYGLTRFEYRWGPYDNQQISSFFLAQLIFAIYWKKWFGKSLFPTSGIYPPGHKGFDLVLCMSIHPGYSGQEFMPGALERIKKLRSLLPAGVHVQVDGGIKFENVRSVYDAGANLLVAARTGYARPAEVQGAHRTSVVAMRPIRCSSRALVAS